MPNANAQVFTSSDNNFFFSLDLRGTGAAFCVKLCAFCQIAFCFKLTRSAFLNRFLTDNYPHFITLFFNPIYECFLLERDLKSSFF